MFQNIVRVDSEKILEPNQICVFTNPDFVEQMKIRHSRNH